MKIGFDNEKYIKQQSNKIKERMKKYDTLYLEVGGKLVDDNHASRVLPGFKKDSKLKMLEQLKEKLEFIFVINASDIESNKIRGDYGITYENYLFKTIDDFRKIGFKINSVVVTLYNNQKGAKSFAQKLENKKIKTYFHTFTKGYPTDIDIIVSDEGYGANPYIKTTRPLVVITSPGANSGKLATSLSQLYHEYKKGNKAGYAKLETFPVWDLPIKHPLNVAYEASTANLKDLNMIDSFHLEAYGKTAVNYNRDLEVFPILRNILYKITGTNVYKSPTEMGINMISECITNNKIVETAAKQEIIRRYYDALCDYKKGIETHDVASRIKVLMDEIKITPDIRKVIAKCLDKSIAENTHVVSLELPNGKIITGKESKLLSASSALVLNAIKELTKIPDDADLLSKSILNPILKYKPLLFDKSKKALSLQEVYIALSICSATNPIIDKALISLDKLAHCEAHASYMLTNGDLQFIKGLDINLTCEPNYYSDDLYIDK
jgi:uncharacterized protein (UPF0371 family)